jgi:hypothetical protein
MGYVKLERSSFKIKIAYVFVDNDLLCSASDVEIEKLVEHKILLHNCKYLQYIIRKAPVKSCSMTLFGIIRSFASIILCQPVHNSMNIRSTILYGSKIHKTHFC